MRIEKEERTSVDDPYRAPGSGMSKSIRRPPRYQTVLNVGIFSVCAFPLSAMLLASAFKILSTTGVHPILFFELLDPSAILRGLLGSALLFLAGSMLLLRSRYAVELFVLNLLATLIAEDIQDRWPFIRLVAFAAFAAYALFLRRRGDLR